MADNEAKIKFTAETEDFNSAIQDANSELQELRSELRLNASEAKANGESQENLEERLQILGDELEAAGEKTEAISEKLETAKEIFGEDSDEVNKLTVELNNAQVVENSIQADINSTNDALENQGKATDEASGSLDQMAQAAGDLGIAAVLEEIGEKAYELAEAFDESQAVIVEGTGASGEALDDLNEQATKAYSAMADKDGSLEDVSGILAELSTRFGVTGDDAEQLTEKVQKFAQHTGTDGVAAVDGIADVMNRWGMDMSDADNLLDDLTTTSQGCKMSVDELTGYLSKNSVQFEELGYSEEDALALMGSLSQSGANMSPVMTGLRQAVSNLSEATDDVPGSFQECINTISQCDNVSEALQAQVGDTGLTIEDVFGTRAAQEISTAVQSGSFAIDEFTATLGNNEGALDDTAANSTTMGDSVSQAMNNITLILQPFSEMMGGAISKVADIIGKFASLVSSTPALQVIITGLAVAFGVLAAAMAIQALINGVQKAMTALNLTMSLNPILLVVAAITALVAAFVYAYNHCEKFRNIVDTAFNGIKTVITTVINVVSTIIQGFVNAALAVFNALKAGVTAVFNVIKTVIINPIQAVATFISNAVSKIKNWLSFGGLGNKVKSVFNKVKSFMSNPISSARTAVSNACSKISSKLGFSGITSKVSSVFGKVKDNMVDKMSTAKEKMSDAVDKIKGFFDKVKLKIPTPSLPSLPHFSLRTKTVTVLKKSFTIPTGFDVAWYAKGAVFQRPTLLATGDETMAGVGEAGAEAVLPIETLRDFVEDAMTNIINRNQVNSEAFDYDKLAAAMARQNITMELNGREMGRLVRGLV